MDGVYETIVGYSGGTSKDPAYHRIGDHMESLQVRFDPEVLSYQDLLKVFWQEHDYSRQPASRQYMNAVFYHTREQKEVLEKSLKKLPGRVETEVLLFSAFYPAEDYHQKFYLQRHLEIKKELRSFYQDFESFVRSTSAARVNGFLGGYGSRDDFERIFPEIGLSPEALKIIGRRYGAGLSSGENE